MHREPCCWKWTSSSAQRSKPARMSLCSFFICPLGLGVGMGDQGSRLSSAKPELAKEPLALPHFQVHAEATFHKAGERLAIPDPFSSHRCFFRALAQGGSDFGQLPLIQPAGTPRPITFRQAREPVVFKTSNPVLHSSWRIAEGSGNLRARHAMSYKKNSVQTMVIPTLVRAADFIVQSGDHGFWVGDV